MAFVLRRSTVPTLQEMLAVPQIVIIDQTGPVIAIGTAPGLAAVVGEFVKGAFIPTEVTDGGEQALLYGASVYPYFSQGTTGIQDGSANPAGTGNGYAVYNGNGNLSLLNRTFRRLAILRVDHEAVTTDQGTTRAQLTVTVTVAASDQDGSGNTAKDIVIPAGTLFGSAASFSGSTRVYATSGDYTIKKGTALTTNAIAVGINCFPVRVVEPIVATAIAAIVNVLTPALNNVATGTSITAVTNATTLWPQGVGTTLATRLEYQYLQAISKLQPGSGITSDIVIQWSARRTQAIRTALVASAVACSDMGRGRVAVVAADPAADGTATSASSAKTAAIGLADSDGYVQPADRAIIAFPHSTILVPDFGGTEVTVDSASRMASTLSNFAEEVNPGAQNAYIQDIQHLEPAFEGLPLSKGDHANLIAAGVCALYHDRAAGWQWMNGVTAANSSSYPTRVPIKRRRMADMIQDSLTEQAAPFLKQPATTENVDTLVAENVSYLELLKSPNAPASQRIVDYLVDPDGGNTADLVDLGIYTILVYVQLLPSMDVILYKTQIGETVTIPVTQQPAAALGVAQAA